MKTQNTVIKKVGECLKDFGLPLRTPRFEDPRTAAAVAFPSAEIKMDYEINHDPKNNMLVFIIFFPDQFPGENVCDIYAAINEFNAHSVVGHFAFSEVTNRLTFRFGYFLVEKEFNKRKFKENFKKILSDAREHYPLLIKLLTAEGATT